MKAVITLIITAGLALSVNATPKKDLPALEKQHYAVVGSVDLKGKTYQKVVKGSPMMRRMMIDPNQKAKLFAGDMIKKGDMSLAAKLNGKLFLSLANSNDAVALASHYGLTIEFQKGNLLVVKAKEGTELSGLLGKLLADPKIAVADLEKVTMLNQPE